MNPNCRICKSPDLAHWIEAGWNINLSAASMSRLLGTVPTAQSITKHLDEHRGDGLSDRTIPVPKAKPMRERVSALQEAMVNEVERRITIAQQRAAEFNATMGAVDGFEARDWSFYFDILDKDNQAAINSILKMQGLDDKRALGKAAIGVDIAKMMLGGGDGLAPKRLTEGVIEGAFKEVPDGGSTE